MMQSSFTDKTLGTNSCQYYYYTWCGGNTTARI